VKTDRNVAFRWSRSHDFEYYTIIMALSGARCLLRALEDGNKYIRMKGLSISITDGDCITFNDYLGEKKKPRMKIGEEVKPDIINALHSLIRKANKGTFEAGFFTEETVRFKDGDYPDYPSFLNHLDLQITPSSAKF
jgi:hypothetical protein